MQLNRIDHVSLDVADRAAALRWYEDVLGLRSDGRVGRADQPVFLGPAGARIALFQTASPGLRHVALATDANEQRRLVERLERRGIPYRPERHRTHDSIYFRDLDGATLEVMVPTA
jgi:catechol 2,3-dioxygenase-like lactoylglutathione lyase family enzyme